MTRDINEKTAIRNLQRYLRQLSYENGDFARVPIDGIFEEETKKALAEFQRQMGLSPTGAADRETWDTLYREYVKSINRSSVPNAVFLFPRVPEGYELQSGDEGALVSILQFMLGELSLIYDYLEAISSTGSYGAETAKAVKEFQSRNDIYESGKVDLETWNEIVNQYNKHAYPYQR